MNCWKCFRKGLLEAALGHSELDENVLEVLLGSTEVRTRLSALPISHENVVSFSLHRTGPLNSNGLKSLSDRVSGLGRLNLLTKWYSPSDELVPEGWRYHCREKIMRYLRPMSSKEESIIENWDMDDFLLSESTISAQRKLIEAWN